MSSDKDDPLAHRQALPTKILVGSQEWCAFPQLGVPAVLARVDSGARTSSIHAFNIQPFTRKSQPWVSFEVHPLQQNRRIVVRCEAPVADLRKVKSSSGVAEKRYVIETVLRLWDHEFAIELTLANRDSMGYRMLLGREAMVGRMMVDPGLSCCLGDVSDESLALHYKRSRRSSDGLRVAILAKSERFYTTRRLIEACEERGHFPSILDVQSCFLTLHGGRGEIYERERGVIPAFDVMIPRFSIEETLFGAGVLRQYIAGGGIVLNAPQAILQSRDKLALFQKMVDNDVPTCAVGFANSVQDLESMVHRMGQPPFRVQLQKHFTVKPSIGLSSVEEVSTLAKAWTGAPESAQVLSRAGHEGARIRVLMLAGRLIGAMESDFSAVDLRESDFSGYEACQLSREEKKLVSKIAKTAGLFFCAIDLVRGNPEDGCALFDILSSPNIEPFEKVTGKDIASLIIVEIERCCDWRQQQSEL